MAAMRVKCPAAFRVGMNKKCGIWVVNQFKFLWSHQLVKGYDMTQSISIKTVGTETNQIMDFLVNQTGGYDTMDFVLEDFYNSLDVKCQSMTLKTNSEYAFAYLKRKTDIDMNFFCKYVVH